MPDIPLITSIVYATDFLMPFTLLSVGFAFRAASTQATGWQLLSTIAVASLVWGAAWSWFPQLSALRLAPPPGGQVLAILGVVLSFIAFRFVPTVRSYWQSAKLEKLVWNGPWRALYGSALLAIGLLGGLPEEFFWSAAAGDIAVGIWAVIILWRGTNTKPKEIIAWNIIGAIDLIHVLALGALFLRPFYLANPDIPLLNLLPLAGVPVLLSIHVMTLATFFIRSKTTPSTTQKVVA